VWVLLNSSAGDNSQLLRLARALGLAFATRTLLVKPEFAGRPGHVVLSTIDPDRSDPLAPPWPDLVLAISSNYPAALWIKDQSLGRSKVVVVGRAKGPSERFDLVISSMEHPAPDQPNVCRIRLPLFGFEPAQLEAARSTWTAKFGDLPGPLTVVLLGGTFKNTGFDAKTVRDIITKVEAVRRRDGGALFISTSRRTPAAAVEALSEVLPRDALLYRWRPGDPSDPYVGSLAAGHRFVVTGDSVSMLVEVARLGKPLAIAPMGPPAGAMGTTLSSVGLGRLWVIGDNLLRDRLLPFLGRYFPGARSRGSRDLGRIHDYLYAGGWAVPLGQPFKEPEQVPPDDTLLAVGRIAALLSQEHSSAP
jgi:hypothetical protein